MNKLHGFLRQRSALTSGSAPPTMPSQWTGRRAMPVVAPPSPLQGSCLAVSIGSTALARLGIVDRIDQEERGGNNFTRIKHLCNYVILSFVYNDLRLDKLVNLKQLISHTEYLTGMEDNLTRPCVWTYYWIMLCKINSRSTNSCKHHWTIGKLSNTVFHRSWPKFRKKGNNFKFCRVKNCE